MAYVVDIRRHRVSVPTCSTISFPKDWRGHCTSQRGEFIVIIIIIIPKRLTTLTRRIGRNTEYVGTAVVVAEYIAKTAYLDHLPPETAAQYTRLLKEMGINVSAANNSAVAQCAAAMALPALKSIFSSSEHDKTSNTNSTFTALADAVSIVRDIMMRVKDAANMPPAKADAHREMAQFISANKNPSADEFEAAAKKAYGDAAHWLAPMLPGIDVNGDVHAVETALGSAYAKCGEWAKGKLDGIQHHPPVTGIVVGALNQSLGLFNPPPPARETPQCTPSLPASTTR